jgi:hypothetical protein
MKFMKSGCFISTPNHSEQSQFETTRIPIFGFLLVFASLTSCGPASNMVTVKLVTGLEKSPAQTNLLRTLSAAPLSSSTSAGFPCIQSDVRVGYNDASTKQVTGFPVEAVSLGQIITTDLNPLPFGSAIDLIDFPEIQLQVPRNTPLGIGIVGAITTGAADPNGICKSFETTTAGAFSGINPSYSIFGSTEFPNGLSNEVVIPIRVWGTLSNAPDISTSGCVGDDCPRERFVRVYTQSSSQSPLSLRVRYFEGESAQFAMFLYFEAYGDFQFIPKAGRIHAQYYSVSGNAWIDCISDGSNQIPIDDIPSAGIEVSCGVNSLTFTALAP